MTYTILSRPLRTSGKPVKLNDRWHIEWTYVTGETSVTPYGSLDREVAEFQIRTVMENEMNRKDETK